MNILDNVQYIYTEEEWKLLRYGVVAKSVKGLRIPSKEHLRFLCMFLLKEADMGWIGKCINLLPGEQFLVKRESKGAGIGSQAPYTWLHIFPLNEEKNISFHLCNRVPTLYVNLGNTSPSTERMQVDVIRLQVDVIRLQNALTLYNKLKSLVGGFTNIYYVRDYVRKFINHPTEKGLNQIIMFSLKEVSK